MDIEKLESLLKKPEGKMIDFKEKLSMSPKGKITNEDLFKDIAAISNAVEIEGWLVFGIVDKTYEVVGLDVPLDEVQIQQKCKTYLDPPVDLEIVNLDFENKVVGVITISPTLKPHKVIQSSGNLKAQKVYVRRGSVNDEATPDEILDFFNQRKVASKRKENKLIDLLQRKKMYHLCYFSELKNYEKGYLQSWLVELNKNIGTDKKLLRFVVDVEYKQLVESKINDTLAEINYKSVETSGYSPKDFLKEDKLVLMYFKSQSDAYKLVRESEAQFMTVAYEYIVSSGKFNDMTTAVVTEKFEDLKSNLNSLIKKIARS